MVELVIAPEFWMSRMLPEGIVERWLVSDGTVVKPNDPVVDLRIEGELVKLKAPAGGKLFIDIKANCSSESVAGRGHISPHD